MIQLEVEMVLFVSEERKCVRERERMNVRIWMRKHNGMEMNEIKRNNLFSLQD